MQTGVREGALEKLMSFPGLCPLDPTQGPVGLSGLATELAGKVLSTTHAKKDLRQTIPYYKLALYKQYLQKILIPALCHATFFEMITGLCEVMACRQRQNWPAGVSIVLIMKEKKFLFLPLEGKSHSQIKCMI